MIRVAAVLAIGCHGDPTPSRPAVPDCTTAVGNVIDRLSAAEHRDVDAMGSETPLRRRLRDPDARARYLHMLDDDNQCAKRAIAKACVDDAWSDAARTCLARANDLPDCATEMTAAQMATVERVAAPCEHHLEPSDGP